MYKVGLLTTGGVALRRKWREVPWGTCNETWNVGWRSGGGGTLGRGGERWTMMMGTGDVVMEVKSGESSTCGLYESGNEITYYFNPPIIQEFIKR